MNPLQLQDAAVLALAAYGQYEISGPSIRQGQLTNLNGDTAGFTNVQAASFISNYQLAIPTYNDQSATGDSNLDLNVFVSRQPGDFGRVVIALRGTAQKSLDDPTNDLMALGDLTLRGAALSQIVALHNWWLRVTTLPADAPDGVPQFAYVRADGVVIPAPNRPATGELVFPGSVPAFLRRLEEEPKATPEVQQLATRRLISFNPL